MNKGTDCHSATSSCPQTACTYTVTGSPPTRKRQGQTRKSESPQVEPGDHCGILPQAGVSTFAATGSAEQHQLGLGLGAGAVATVQPRRRRLESGLPAQAVQLQGPWVNREAQGLEPSRGSQWQGRGSLKRPRADCDTAPVERVTGIGELEPQPPVAAGNTADCGCSEGGSSCTSCDARASSESTSN